MAMVAATVAKFIDSTSNCNDNDNNKNHIDNSSKQLMATAATVADGDRWLKHLLC